MKNDRINTGAKPILKPLSGREEGIFQQIQQDIGTAIDLQEVLNRILRWAVELVGAGDGSLMLMEEDGRLHFHARVGGLSPGDKAERTFIPGAPDEGIAGWVVRNRKPYVCQDTKTDTQFVDIVAGTPIRSLVSVPITSHGVVLGVVNVDSSEPNRFSVADVELLVALANQVAVAIERAELLDSLQQIGEKTLVGAEDLHQHIVNVVHRLTRCPVSMWRVDETGEQARIVAFRGISAKYVQETRLDLDHSVTGKAIRERKIIPVLDIQADPDFQNKQEAAREGWQSMLVVPLLAGPERAVGTLSIYSTIKREEFTRWELDLLRVCAGQAGVAIQNAERLRMIQRLNEVGRSLGTLQESPEAFQETLKQIADAAIEVLGADVVDLYQYRADRDDFVLPPIMVGERRVPDLVPTQISPDDVVVEIAYTGEAIYTSDAQEHPLLAGDWEFPREERPKERFVVREGIISSAAVPMKVGEEVLGVMFAGYRQRRDFDTDVELREKIEVLANQGAIAISNARLFEKERRRAKELEVVNEIGRAVSARGIEEIAELIYEQTSRLMDTTNFFICLYDKDREELSFELWMYKEQPLEKFSNKLSGLTGWIVREKKPLLIRDWDEEESRFPVKADIQTMRQRSWLGVPLLVGEEVIGVISVQSPEPYAFNPDTQRLLETIASQAAIAIKNAQLFEELDERAKQFVQLQAVTAAISAEPSNLERVSRLIVDSLGNIFYNASCAIRLYDSATDEFRPQIGTGVIAKWIDRLPRSDGTSRYVVKSKTARYLEGNDVVTPSDGGPSVREDILALGIKAVAYLPLTSRGDVVGVLYVNLTVPHRFSENDKLLLGLFADQAAIAIENTRLYTELDRRVRQLEVLAGIYERIIAVGIEDVDRILDLLYEEASEVMDLSNAQVQMAFYDEIRDEVTFPLAMEQDGGDIIDVVRWAKREAQYRKLGESEVVEQFKPRARREPPGLTEHVIRTEQPLLITEDFEQRAAGLGITVWPTFGRLDRPTHSWLGVPMIVQDRVIGIISIQSLEVEHAFDQGNVELLTTVASQAAVAIENARLYQDLEQKIKELAQAQNRLVTAERLTLMSQVAAEFVHRLGNLVGTIPVRVALIKEKLDPADASDSAILHIAEGIKTDTEGLLQFARDLERPTIRLSPEPVDLNQLVRNAVVQQGVPSNVRLVENLSPSIPDIMAPKDHLLETLKNLLGNAIDAMPEGGTLTITTQILTRDGRRFVELDVSDMGIGISLEDQERIFELFYTTKPGGLGYGLWRDKNLLENLGGEIRVESEPKKGSTFIVLIPIDR